MTGKVEDLRVFQLAYGVSLEVHRATLSWPKVEQFGGIAGQLRRSSKAICALLVEGIGRSPGSRREFERYLMMAIASADESSLWCRYAEDLGYATQEQADAWRATFSEVARMMHGLLARQKATGKPRNDQFSPDN